MARHRTKRLKSPLLSRAMREAADAMARRLKTARPDAQGTMAAKLSVLAREIAAQEKRESETRENLAELRREQEGFDAEFNRLVEIQVADRARWMLQPPDWEMDSRAKQVAHLEGGDWLDHLPRVYAEQSDFIARLLDRDLGDTDLRRIVREARAGRG